MGEGGFELPEDYRNDDLSPAPWSQTKNHTRLDHPPIIYEKSSIKNNNYTIEKLILFFQFYFFYVK